MDASVLGELGLSKNEIAIYLALLEIGSSTASDISKKSKVHRTNVYDALNGLVKKGLAAHVERSQIKFYEAADPSNLMNIIKEKEFSVAKIIPELQLKKELAPSGSSVKIVEGIRAIRQLLEEYLESGENRDALGIPTIAVQKLGLGWMEEYHKRRQAKNIRLRHIYNEEAKERIKYLKNLQCTDVKYLPKEFSSPVTTDICGEIVSLSFWEEKEPISIIIKNKQVADAYRRYFELMWHIAKSP